nr:unnamed protein product [Digitaria exilis]
MEPHRRSSAAPTRYGAVTTPFPSDAAGGGRSRRWRRQEPAEEEAGAGDEGSRWAATAEAGRGRRRQRRSEAAEETGSREAAPSGEEEEGEGIKRDSDHLQSAVLTASCSRQS